MFYWHCFRRYKKQNEEMKAFVSMVNTIMVATTLVMSYPDKRAAVCMYDDDNMYFENQCGCRYNNERCCCVSSGKIECAFHPNCYHIGMEVIYYTYISNLVYEEFEDTQGSIIIRISTKNRYHNGQKKSTKGQTTIYKTYI